MSRDTTFTPKSLSASEYVRELFEAGRQRGLSSCESRYRPKRCNGSLRPNGCGVPSLNNGLPFTTLPGRIFSLG